SPRRVEFGDAAPINDALRRWLVALTGWRPDGPDAERRDLERQAAAAAADVRRLVWDKLAAALPADTRTVYLAPDGDLARLPWAALPGATAGSVLLERYAFAVVPHGAFLLDQLASPPRSPAGPEAVLAV